MKEIFVERTSSLLRIAIKNNNKLEECYIEEDNNHPLPGEIYKGVVKNIVPAIKCAFIDIGWNKNAYMYMDSKFHNKNIKKGQELIVEVVKEETSQKGPKVTSAFTIPGRYAVLMTLDKKLYFSQKIQDESIKSKLRKSLKKLDDVGIMIRTNAEQVEAEIINEEIDNLYGIYKNIKKQARFSMKPGLLYSDEGTIDRILRDIFPSHAYKIIVNDEEDYNYIEAFIKKQNNLDITLLHHQEERSLFDYYGIERELLALRNPRVNLSCGGSIIIEKTEGMVVIDVNSGKNVSGSSLQKTSYSTNLCAAVEIARQVRLRNLSGIILVDFIDMDDIEHKREVLATLKSGFTEDKNKTVIYDFTELNLVQIARRRRGKSINDYMEEPCSHCKGKGKRIKLSYLENLIRNALIKIHKEQLSEDIYIELDENYKDEVLGDVISFIKEIDALNNRVYVNFISNFDYFKVEPLFFSNQIKNLESYKIYG